jgi:hypothetical protein
MLAKRKTGTCKGGHEDDKSKKQVAKRLPKVGLIITRRLTIGMVCMVKW